MKRAFDMERFQRRFAENLAAARASASIAPIPEVGKGLTTPRPLLAESPRRVAPMSESEYMRNNEAAGGEVIDFPVTKREEPRRVFSVLRETLSLLSPPGTETCPAVARALHNRFAERGDHDAQAMLVVRCGLCAMACSGRLR